eukprot:COSAG02_NODE_1122_length_14450_cov_4.124173_17_plen_81_part_01
MPKMVVPPVSAKTKGAPGPKKKVLPAWCSRKTRRWPEEAMAKAIALLRPVATPQKKQMNGNSKFAQSDCELVVAHINAQFS